MDDKGSIINAYRDYANQGEKNRPIERQNKEREGYENMKYQWPMNIIY